MKQAKSNSNRWNSEYGGISNRSGIQIMEVGCPILENQRTEVFPIDGYRITGVGWRSEVTRGGVDNENNSQSQYLNISNIVQGGGSIYTSLRA